MFNHMSVNKKYSMNKISWRLFFARNRDGGVGFNLVTFFIGIAIPLFLATPIMASSPSLLSQSFTVRHVSQGAQLLEVGKSIARKMTGGETHAYRLKLAAGQALHAVVNQHGIDVVVTLLGADGKQVVEIDNPNGAYGSEIVWAVADTSGDYRLEVSSLEKAARHGQYELTSVLS